MSLLTLLEVNAECLIHLNLSFMQASEFFISKVLTLLGKIGLHSVLRSLNLSGHVLSGDADLESLHFLTHIEDLFLEGCVLDTVHIKGLCKFIQKSHTIQKLSIHLSSDVDAHLLSEAAGQNFSLAVLDLLDTESKIISCFTSSLPKNTCLKQFKCNALSKDAMADLASLGVEVIAYSQV
jgi:hypothetical protein